MATATLSNVLVRLIDAAERAINRNALTATADSQDLVLLHEEVSERIARPSEGERIVGSHEILLADVLIKIINARAMDSSRAPLFCQVAGVLLPVVREDMFRVMCAERDARVSTTEQTRDGR